MNMSKCSISYDGNAQRQNEINRLQQKLLQSQASEARLRADLNTISQAFDLRLYKKTKELIECSLSTPPKTAELDKYVESEIERMFEVVAWVCGGELYLTKEMADSSKRDWSLVANQLYAKKG
jgi:hypothetical protein